jgi:hypothetical protein
MIAPNDRLVDELLQGAEVNVCNASKCYVPNLLACAYQNPASVMTRCASSGQFRSARKFCDSLKILTAALSQSVAYWSW